MALPFSSSAELPAPELRPLKNNLIDVAQKGPDSARWERGGGFVDFACLRSWIQAPNCPPADLHDPQSCPGTELFSPVLLETSISWDTLTYGDAAKQVIEALDRTTSSLLEYELEFGDEQAGNSQLENATDLGPFPGAQAVGAVQDALIKPDNGSASMGTLLMSYQTAIAVNSALDDDDTNKVFTKYGQWPVVLGNFTPGVVFGVPGMIDVYLDDIQIVDHLERSTNEMLVAAQRLALVTFHSCMMFKAQVAVTPV